MVLIRSITRGGKIGHPDKGQANKNEKERRIHEKCTSVHGAQEK
jgi:hypothetical protein